MVADEDENEILVPVALHEGDQCVQGTRSTARRPHGPGPGRPRARPWPPRPPGMVLKTEPLPTSPQSMSSGCASTVHGSTPCRSLRRGPRPASRARGVAKPRGRTGRASERSRTSARHTRGCAGRRPCRSRRTTLRPLTVIGRHVVDGAPSGALECVAQREPVARDELVVAPLPVHPDSCMQRGVRQPAGAERRRREEGASCLEAGGAQALRPSWRGRSDAGRDRGILDGHSSVALDERDDDVLAAQPGQKLVARGGPEPVATDLVGEDRGILDPGAHRAYLVDGQAGGARRGDRHLGDELRSERPAKNPGGAEGGDRVERPPADRPRPGSGEPPPGS